MPDRGNQQIWGDRGGWPLVVYLGALTAFAPMSIDMYLPAFPAIAGELAVSTVDIQQTLSVFFLGMACGQLVYGPLSDRFGRRGPLICGLLIYIAASLGCALSTSVHMLIVGRLFQALGGCSGIVIARAIVRDRFAPMHVARIFSQLMLVMGLAPVLAPFIGAQLLAFFGWRSTFFAMAAFGLACLAATILRLRDDPHRPRGSGHPFVMARTFWQILGDRSFIVPAMVVAFSQAALFTYIVASPAALMGHFGVRPAAYGVFFAANAFALIGSAQINARLLLHHSPWRLLSWAVMGVAAIGLAVAVLCWTGAGGLWSVVISLFALLGSMGFVGANASACALAGQGGQAGSASALLGTLQFLLAAGAGAAVSGLEAVPFVENSLQAMGSLIFFCALISVVIHRLFPYQAGRL